MTCSAQHTTVLVRHPDSPRQAVRGVGATAGRAADGALLVGFTLEGDLERLRIPPAGTSRRRERLWEHTCFEVFVAIKGTAAYREFNFAPSSEWAAYVFQGYREAVPSTQKQPVPKIEVQREQDHLRLDAVIPLHTRLALAQRNRLSLALSAVIEGTDGSLSYWALEHPPGKPDFHHPIAFALDLDPPDVDVLNLDRTRS